MQFTVFGTNEKLWIIMETLNEISCFPYAVNENAHTKWDFQFHCSCCNFSHKFNAIHLIADYTLSSFLWVLIFFHFFWSVQNIYDLFDKSHFHSIWCLFWHSFIRFHCHETNNSIVKSIRFIGSTDHQKEINYAN